MVPGPAGRRPLGDLPRRPAPVPLREHLAGESRGRTIVALPRPGCGPRPYRGPCTVPSLMEEPLNVTEPSMSTEPASGHRADGMPVRATPAPASERPPLDLARRVVELAEDKKAADIVLLDLGGLTTMADYFVICSGGSERQSEAIASGITGSLRAGGPK